jgi:bacteriorhodopsin
LAIGIGGFIGWELTWPLIIIAVGLAIILGVFLRPRF